MLIISKMSSCKQKDNSKASTEMFALLEKSNRIVTHGNTLNQIDTIMTNDFVITQEKKIVSKINYQKTIIRIIFLTLSILVLLVNFHFLIFFDLEINLKNASFLFSIGQPRIKFLASEKYLETSCSPKKSFYYYSDFMEDWWFTVDIFFTFIIPFLTISFTFVFICLKLRILNRSYLELSREKSNKYIYVKKIKRNRLVLFKLFILNFYFLLSIFPYFLFKTFFEKDYNFLNTLIMILFYSNNALNVLFYGISCQKFREKFTVAFCKKNS